MSVRGEFESCKGRFWVLSFFGAGVEDKANVTVNPKNGFLNPINVTVKKRIQTNPR